MINTIEDSHSLLPDGLLKTLLGGLLALLDPTSNTLSCPTAGNVLVGLEPEFHVYDGISFAQLMRVPGAGWWLVGRCCRRRRACGLGAAVLDTQAAAHGSVGGTQRVVMAGGVRQGVAVGPEPSCVCAAAVRS